MIVSAVLGSIGGFLSIYFSLILLHKIYLIPILFLSFSIIIGLFVAPFERRFLNRAKVEILIK